MTYNGAINQLYEMRNNTLMPEFFKPYFDKIIETLTADVRENVKGEWISKMVECSRENYDQVFCCSVCGVSNDWRRTNFCPHCGADMRGES